MVFTKGLLFIEVGRTVWFVIGSDRSEIYFTRFSIETPDSVHRDLFCLLSTTFPKDLKITKSQ